MRPPLSIALTLALFVAVGHISAAEITISKGTIEEAKDRSILTTDGKVFTVDANTVYARHTAKGDVPAKFTDLKPGTRIEVYQEAGAKQLKKVRIIGP